MEDCVETTTSRQWFRCVILSEMENAIELNADKLLDCLIAAVMDNQATVVNWLIIKGANPNGYQDNDKVSPLHHAVVCGALACAKILLQHKADPLLPDVEGLTAIQLAQVLEKSEFCDLFHEKLGPVH